MKAIIKQYEARHGYVIVEVYKEGGEVEYHVRYDHPTLSCNAWYKSKRDAIAYAQFLAAKY